MKLYAVVIQGEAVVSVIDEGACEVFRDIVSPQHGVLTGADDKLAEYGYQRTGWWEKSPAQWTAEIQRKKKEA